MQRGFHFVGLVSGREAGPRVLVRVLELVRGVERLRLFDCFENLVFLERRQSRNLSGKGISSLPESFGMLDRLTTLDLSNNQLTGNIPKSLGNISTFRILNLANKKLSGEISGTDSISWANVETLSVGFYGAFPELSR
ncbi:hypothetical protein R1flu_014904 [Riccia fluitans]|uniref:Uncharacterized protein n=1 Tax=Riccia fluitans TaxID=41844 RepID=A0ABD1YHT1_9MARC